MQNIVYPNSVFFSPVLPAETEFEIMSLQNNTSYGLYFCLTFLLKCVGIIVEPIAVTYWVSQAMQRSDICRYAIYLTYVTGHVLFLLSLLTITAISIDRLLALLLGLRYRQVVTLKRT